MSDVYRYDGHTEQELRAILGVPRLELRATLSSTLNLAHDLAESGAPPGTLILADSQTEGRGRHGRQWRSDPGSGVWLTLLDCVRVSGTELLSIRLGLCVAESIEEFAGFPVQIKWPNDLYLNGGKLAGILVESRWRGEHLEWTAMGLGVNVLPPIGVPHARGLCAGTSRVDVLRAVVPAMRRAAAMAGALSSDEEAILTLRDLARGKACSQPATGRVRGIARDGALIIESAAGIVRARDGSLVLEDDV